jgi:hypothetical protein
MNFSDYIVYVDESGDHSLVSIDAQFPVFSLSFCVVEKSSYTEKVVPLMQEFKFQYWGHDAVVLHEHEIRKTKGDFAFLRTNADLRARFLSDMEQLVSKSPFQIIACVIDKNAHVEKYGFGAWNPYKVALKMCMERLLLLLRQNCEAGRRIHIVFECRGKDEDAELELEFRRIVAGQSTWGWINRDFSDFDWEPRFAKKAANSTGLQLADLTARPLALRVLRPEQPNRAYAAIEPKLAYFKSFP